MRWAACSCQRAPSASAAYWGDDLAFGGAAYKVICPSTDAADFAALHKACVA